MSYTDERILQLIDAAFNGSTETNNLEFKDGSGGMPKDLWRAISSFSHSPDGGIIVFGVPEDNVTKKLSLVQVDLAKTQEGVSTYFATNMINCLTPIVRLVEYQGVTLVAVIVRETDGDSKPCYYKHNGLPDGACIRVGNTNKIINHEEMRRIIRDSTSYKFDQLPAEETDVNMLSVDKIEEFLSKSAKKTGRPLKEGAALDTALLSNLGIIIKETSGEYKPTVGGFLIFSNEDPQQVNMFSRYLIRCIRYGGTNSASPIVDKADISGTLDEQIEEVQKFILKNTPLRAEIVKTKRVETYVFPEQALRELVANAIIHRDYRIAETYTQVAIFSNRIEISNAGNLPPGVSVENLKDAQFSRNEIIASILKDMDYLEEYGRGINIVFQKMAEAGLPDPIFKNVSNTFKVTLLGEVFNELNERQFKIWQMLQEKLRVTTKECMALFNDSISRPTITNDLNKLIELGLTRSVGSANNTHYILTD